MSTQAVIAIDELQVVAGGRRILDVPRLRVANGQVVGVLGPNGSGKTTLLKTLLGLVRPSQGVVEVLGTPVWGGGGTAEPDGSAGSPLTACAAPSAAGERPLTPRPAPSAAGERPLTACAAPSAGTGRPLAACAAPCRSSGGLSGLRSRIGYVPQLAGVPTDVPLTAREVVVTGRSARAGLWHRLTRADWRAAQEWLDRLGLGAMGGRVFAELSGGEQRKVLIARAMVHDPELLLLDEPTAFLDLGWREQIVRVMETLHADRRLTLLVVCHEPEVLPACCDRVMLLDHGRVAAEGPAGQVLTDAHVEGWYGQELSIVQHAGRFGVVARSLAAGLSAAAGGRPLTSCAAPSAAGGRPLTSCAAPSAAAPSTAPSTAPADPQPGGQSPRP